MTEEVVLKVGDVVQLKSGGPVMTIAELDGKDEARCTWFDGNNPMGRRYELVVLKLYSPEEDLPPPIMMG